MQSRNFSFGIIDNPLIFTPFNSSESQGGPSPPPPSNALLLTDNTNFLLTDGSSFLLAGA